MFYEFLDSSQLSNVMFSLKFLRIRQALLSLKHLTCFAGECEDGNSW